MIPMAFAFQSSQTWCTDDLLLVISQPRRFDHTDLLMVEPRAGHVSLNVPVQLGLWLLLTR